MENHIISKYSVLMSVYYKEHCENLKMAMDSIWNQTVKTDDFVLVCDGPLNQELDSFIAEMQSQHSELRVVRLEKNSGLGNALNIGIKYCKNELVARMDSDDISRPERCEKQIEVFQQNPNMSICSGTVEEFSESIELVEARRVLPERHEEILCFARTRNPFNHPCVMYKKSAVEASGGYISFYLLEDYFLWIRMLHNGYLGYNIQQPLLWMRAGSEMYRRRAGWEYVKSQKALFKYMNSISFITKGQYIRSVLVRSASSLMPNEIRKVAFKYIVRK